MPRQLWNQGRVVGYSAYELYVRQQASENPEIPPASEREWLASTIAMGSSMLMRVDADTNHAEDQSWIKEVQLPSNTKLCAANTIMASFFLGEGEYGSEWANRILDYGRLISNNAHSSPSTGHIDHSENIPNQGVSEWSDSQKLELAQYMKIVDGIVIQPGKWSVSKNKPPQKDFSPDMGDYPRIRLHIRGPIETPFQILLTGFTIRTVVQGISGLDSATSSPAPEDGDFLGPGQFPWASKIIFSVPSSYVTFFASGAYKRKLPASSQSKLVKDTPVIDMQTTDPATYYNTHNQNARVSTNVDNFTTLGEGTAVLSVYQKDEKYPPAIWGTFVTNKGANNLHPLDVVAPGTVKMFEDASAQDLKNYESIFPGTFGMNKDSSDGTISVVGPSGTLVPAAKVSVKDLSYTNIVSGDKTAKALVTETGNLRGLSISASEGVAGKQYTIENDAEFNETIGNTKFNVGSLTKLLPPTSNITVGAILEALANNKSIDILGDNLKAIKAGLPKNYIQFPNGLRFYISSTKPTDTDVPVGSIGIGWGFNE